MKIFTSFLLCFVCCTVASLAQDPFEPNDDSSNPATISCGNTYQAFIQTVGDVDWYRVEMPQPGVLQADLSGTPLDLDLRIETYKYAGGLPVQIADDNYINVGNNTPVSSIAFVEAGTYLIRITDENNNQANSTVPYTLVITCITDLLEVNQTISLAAAIPSDTCFNGTIWGENEEFWNPVQGSIDQDWFKVEVTESGVLNASLSGNPLDLNLRIETHKMVSINQSVRIADDNYSSVGDNTPVSSIAYVDSGTYYIAIFDQGYNETSPDPYNFCVSFQPDALEVNQTIDLAASIPSDTCFNGRIWGENEEFWNPVQGSIDQDWFKVVVAEPGVLNASLTGNPLDLNLRIETYRRENNQAVRIANDNYSSVGDNTPVSSVAFVEPDTFYIAIFDQGYNETSPDPYNFCVSFQPDALEVNQTIDLAVAIPSDTCFNGTIWGENEDFYNPVQGSFDQDWFKVEVTESGVLNASLTGNPLDLDLRIETYKMVSKNQSVRIANDNYININNNTPVSSIAYVEPGIYYIAIFDRYYNETSPDPYNFCIEFLPNSLEVNQTIDLAAPIPLDTCLQDNLWGENEPFANSLNDYGFDEDWYQVTVDTACRLKAELTNVPLSLDLNLEIVREVGNQVEVVAGDGDNNSSGGQSLTSEADVEPGVYFIHVNDENYNETSAELFSLCVSCEGLVAAREVNAESLLVFPNPVKGILNIVGLTVETWYTLFSVDGKIAGASWLQNDSIDLSGLEKGLYILTLTSDQFLITRKIIVE